MKTARIFSFGLLVGLLAVVGCASTAKTARMTTPNPSLGKTFSKTVAVQVVGAKEASASCFAHVKDEDFAKALGESLRASGMFTSVVEPGQADLVLNATLVNMRQSLIGGTVDAEAVWSLTAKGEKQPFWQKSVTSCGKSKAFAGSTRIRHSVEAAMQENIKNAMVELSQVKLPEGK